MELKHLRSKVMITLEELEENDCIDCEYYTGCKECKKVVGVSFCDEARKITELIDLLEDSKRK